MGRTIEELDQTMSHVERERWKTFNMIEPIGDVRSDRLFAMLAAVFERVMAGSPLDMQKFLMHWGPREMQELIPEGTTDIKAAMDRFWGRS